MFDVSVKEMENQNGKHVQIHKFMAKRIVKRRMCVNEMQLAKIK